jgi:FKBP-type peptidyl-prolyl cis-trans isomerase 2
MPGTTNLEDAILQEGTGPSVAAGDTVSVQYTGVLENGEEFDNGTLEFTVGAGEMIPGFDEAVATMKEGEEKRFTVTAEKGYGPWDPANVLEVPLTRAVNKTVEVTVEEFRSAFGVDPVVGQQYFNEGMAWNISVVSVSGDTMLIEHMPKDGAQIESPYGTETVRVSGGELEITLAPKIGETVSTPYGDIKITGSGNGTMSLDFNSPLAGKNLIFTVKVLSVTKAETAAAPDASAAPSCAGLDVTKSSKPVLDVFIMSYCPYGLQMQKAVLPVMSLLGSKAQINIKWVSYAMHGKQEVDENTVQYCIQKDFPGKYVAYANCFTASGTSAPCVQSADIDSAALSACIAQADSQFNITGLFNDQSTWSGGRYPPYMVNYYENAQYGVQGSPTTVLNGKVVSLNRSPEDVKKAVCCAFNTMPAECSTVLSTAAASPSFGGGAGTSSTGSC